MYYPLSQITSNLYTNGEEYIIASTKQPYSGYYWKTSQGDIFSGRTPQDTPVQKLIALEVINPLINTEQQNGALINITLFNPVYNNTLPSNTLPYYSPTLPTQQDYQNGEMRRYFCKKTNETIYLEINKDTYNKLVTQDITIAYQYYQPFNIPWQLTDTKEQTYTVNKNIVELTMKQQKLPMLDVYLKKDYLKYYQ